MGIGPNRLVEFDYAEPVRFDADDLASKFEKIRQILFPATSITLKIGSLFGHRNGNLGTLDQIESQMSFSAIRPTVA